MNVFQKLHTAVGGLVLGGLCLIVLFIPTAAQANTVLIRPASQLDGGTAVPVLVQFTPSASGTETGVSVAVDNAWSVSSVAGDHTTSTAGLPGGIAPWPGMGPAVSVAGQTIRFPSTDLAVGTTYGFYITGGIGVNPSGPHTRSYLWQVTTLNGMTTIETSNQAAVPVQSNNQIQITASVLPQPSDLSVTIQAIDPPVGEIAPDTTLNYTITYENLYSSSTPLTVQASWNLGTLEGTGTPSIDILSYVPGSATDGYASSPPVIDTLLRTITWTIPSLPTASGPQTINFSLKTNTYDSAAKTVTFYVTSAAVAPISTVPDELAQTYRGATAPTPAPTPTPSPTASTTTATTTTTTTTATPTPQPSQAAAPLTIQSVKMLSITDESATFQVVLSQPATLSVAYRPSLAASEQTLRDAQLQQSHTMLLPRLTSTTHYIFSFVAQSASGQLAQSDRYTFMTASTPQPAQPISAIRLTSQGVLLASLDQHNPPTLAIPSGSELEVSLLLAPELIAQSFILEQQLGLWQSQSPFEQTINREFIARLQPSGSGTLQLLTRLLDSNGNLSTLPIAQLLLVAPLHIQDTESNPIEYARVLIKKYNPDTRLYEVIPANSLSKTNPVMSDVRGDVPLILPIGSYQFEVSAPGFAPATHTFVLTNESSYPVITLENEVFPIIGRIKYVVFVANQMLELYLIQLRGSALSPTLYAAAAFLTCTFFLILTTLALAARTHISFWSLPRYIWHRSRIFATISREKQYYVRGQLISKDTKKPVSRAAISLLDAQTDEVLATLTTDRSGYFHWRTTSSHTVTGRVTAIGFMACDLDFSTDDQLTPMVFELEENPTVAEARLHRLVAVGESLLGSLFEALLVVAVVLQVFFFSHTSLLMQVILIFGTVINVTVWSLYQSTPREHQLRRSSSH